MRKLAIAVVGVGAMGKHHLRVLKSDENVNLVAIADINKKLVHSLSEKYHCKYYFDYRKLLYQEKLDAVIVAVPTSLHYEVALQALSVNLHVFVEKPFTDDIQKGEKLIKEAKLRNLKIAVGHIERFNPSVLELKKYLQRKEIGKIVSLSAKRVGLYPPSALDTNVVLDLAIHDIDIFSYLLDCQPLKVVSYGGKALNSKREDYADILLTYPKSTFGLIQVNWITPVKIRTLSVTGTKGYLELDYINQKLSVYRNRILRSFDTFGEFLVKFGKPDIIERNIEGGEPLLLELQHFVQCILQNKKPLVDGQVGLNALKVVLEVLKSIRSQN